MSTPRPKHQFIDLEGDGDRGTGSRGALSALSHRGFGSPSRGDGSAASLHNLH